MSTISNTSNDRRLELAWFKLTDRMGVVRLITPVVEDKEKAVPGILRYRDGSGHVSFIDQMWYRDHHKRAKPEDLAKLPVLSANEIERLFPRPVKVAVPLVKADPNAKLRQMKPKFTRKPKAKKSNVVVEVRRKRDFEATPVES